MSVRDLRASDVAALLTLDGKCWPESLWSSAETIRRLAARRDETDIAVGAEVSGRLVGAVFAFTGTRGGGTVQLLSLAVHPNRRRAGLGRALFAEVMARAKERGCHRIVARACSDEARAFLEAMGARATGARVELAPGVGAAEMVRRLAARPVHVLDDEGRAPLCGREQAARSCTTPEAAVLAPTDLCHACRRAMARAAGAARGPRRRNDQSPRRERRRGGKYQ